MMAQVVVNETGDEVIAVVIAGLQTQRQRVTDSIGRSLQCLRLELNLEKVITITLIDQQRQSLRGLGQQRAGIPLAPARTVVAQVIGERLLAPGTVERVTDRRKRRDRLVAPRILQRANQRAVAAH